MAIQAGGSAVTGVYLGDQLLAGGGINFDDLIKTFAAMVPGAKAPIRGTWDLGYFGKVNPEQLGTFDDGAKAGQLVTATTLAAQAGITTGTMINDTITWHKFVREGEVILVAEKPIRYRLSWVDIAKTGCVFGRNKQSIGGLKYGITLLTGLRQEVENVRTNNGSEWDDLLIPLTDGRFATLTDEDLGVKSGNGYASWCQDTTTGAASVDNSSYTGLYRSLRGYGSAAGMTHHYASDVYVYFGWRPALRFTF